MSFWNTFNGPIYALAPMEDVTDTVFRQIILKISDPQCLNVVFGEFTSTDGLCHPIGKDRVSHRLLISDTERKILNDKNIKIVAQIWGHSPEIFAKATKLINEEYKFDGIDINMGCPVKKIVKQASCSELIRFPELAKEIILATKESSKIPISVKTRTGIKFHETEKWIESLMSVSPAAITLHARTQKMMSDYPADWEQLKVAKEVRDSIDKNVPLIGNGDLVSMSQSNEMITKYQIDGVMIGRGIFKNPWLFNNTQVSHSRIEKIELMKEHFTLFINTWGNDKGIAIMKKFFKIYTSEFFGAAELRGKLMELNNSGDIIKLMDWELEKKVSEVLVN
ncbi:MAG TPA: tRNA-dihydrouridine synthase [Candidatus Kapabacteria bacterium]|nr:tRNA-dihydrouridine synthase [Candidatus Kapabacteria bacterium]